MLCILMTRLMTMGSVFKANNTLQELQVYTAYCALVTTHDAVFAQ